ncbi:hypothetical protein NX059_012018 [Plenodomus lindquistii]|nr:hypothetical protein NX059_012018 [Plenodomus lindquistii]
MSELSTDSNTGLQSPPATPPRRLATPYIVGSRFIAQRHQPSSTECTRSLRGKSSRGDSLKDASQLDWCLSHPPDTGGALTSEYRPIQVDGLIRTGGDCGAQILLVDDGLIAKVYDPLFYQFHFDYDWAPPKHPQKRNVTLQADRDYMGETAAYVALVEAGHVGTIAPVFHGSWIINVPVEVEGLRRLRPVHMILMEYVIGTAMLDIKPQDLTEAERENIMHKVVEAETDLVIAGVSHADFEPRNIILSPPSSPLTPERDSTDSTAFADPDLRVCIMDFALCTVYPRMEGEPFRYRNPLFEWIDNDIWSDYGWLPPTEEAGQWMWRMWGDGGKDGKYVAVKEGANRSRILLKDADSEGEEGETALQKV